MRAAFVRFRLHKTFLLKAHTNYRIRFNSKVLCRDGLTNSFI